MCKAYQFYFSILVFSAPSRRSTIKKTAHLTEYYKRFNPNEIGAK